jgi:hypothetical protein
MLPKPWILARKKLMEFQADETSVETLEVLIGLAANFVHQSTRYKIKGFIAERANEFETLTASDSPFDLRRALISQALSTKRSGPYNQTEQTRFPVIMGEILPRLNSLDSLQWEWERACDDVESLRSLEIKEETTIAALEDWRQILWDLKIREEEDHLFGCYLLRQCFLAQEDRKELAKRMFGKKIGAIKVIQETAEFLYAEVKEASLAAAARKRTKSSDAPLELNRCKWVSTFFAGSIRRPIQKLIPGGK